MNQNSDKYNTLIFAWADEFKKNILKSNNSFEFYPLNKDFLNYPADRGNLNIKIIDDENNIVDINKTFLILDESTWTKIKSHYPNEIELKIKGLFYNKKCILTIKEAKIYYFYYINEKGDIEEGYFIFKEYNFANKIISKFQELNIYDFFKEFNINFSQNIINKPQKITYKEQNFYFIIKDKDRNNSNNKDNLFRLNKGKKELNNNNDLFINNRINRFKTNNNVINININNEKEPLKIFDNHINNDKIIKDEKIFLNSLKIYECAYYYFHFENYLQNSLEESQNEHKEYYLYLIDKNWINNFKSQFNNVIIVNKKNGVDFNTHIYNLARKNPINNSILKNKPKNPKKKIIKNNEYYYDMYKFIDENTCSIFLKSFNIYKYNFVKHRVIILKNSKVILIYDKYKFELIDKKERFLFMVKSSEYLNKIINRFLSTYYNVALMDINIDITKKIYEQKIIYNNNEIGNMINISIFENENQRYLSENNINRGKNLDMRDMIIKDNNKMENENVPGFRNKSVDIKKINKRENNFNNHGINVPMKDKKNHEYTNKKEFMSEKDLYNNQNSLNNNKNNIYNENINNDNIMNDRANEKFLFLKNNKKQKEDDTRDEIGYKANKKDNHLGFDNIQNENNFEQQHNINVERDSSQNKNEPEKKNASVLYDMNHNNNNIHNMHNNMNNNIVSTNNVQKESKMNPLNNNFIVNNNYKSPQKDNFTNEKEDEYNNRIKPYNNSGHKNRGFSHDVRNNKKNNFQINENNNSHNHDRDRAKNKYDNYEKDSNFLIDIESNVKQSENNIIKEKNGKKSFDHNIFNNNYKNNNINADNIINNIKTINNKGDDTKKIVNNIILNKENEKNDINIINNNQDNDIEFTKKNLNL